MFRTTKNTILKLRNLGVSAELNPVDLMRIKLANDLILGGILISLILLLTTLFSTNLLVLIPIILSIILQVLTCYLIHCKRFQFAFFYAVTSASLFFAILNLIIIDDFGVQFTFLLSVYLAYVLFDSIFLKLLIIVMVVSLYMVSEYFGVYIPIEYRIELQRPYLIKSILFIFYVLWVGRLINHYHEEVVEEEEKVKELIDKLQQKNHHLKNASDEIERFKYIASHDLKSPLRSIIGFLDLMDIRLNQEQYEALKVYMPYIEESSTQMNLLIESILDFSMVNRENIQIENIVLTDVLGTIMNDLDNDLKDKNVCLELHGNLPIIQSDKKLITTVFYNLIENGFTYNRQSAPVIKVSSVEDEEQVSIMFQDNGIGINEEYHEKVFQYFKRLHTYKEYVGSGLGLGICKKIIQKMNGDITLKSIEGQGSIFKLILPKKHFIKH